MDFTYDNGCDITRDNIFRTQALGRDNISNHCCDFATGLHFAKMDKEVRLLAIISLIILTCCCNCKEYTRVYRVPEVQYTCKSLKETYNEWLIQRMEWEREMDSLVELQNKNK